VPSEEKPPRREAPALLACSEPLVSSLYEQSDGKRWGLTRAQFALGLERSVRKRFVDASPSRERLEEYLAALHAEDLALASACLEGSNSAWEYFVNEYRGYLRAAAGAITKASKYGSNPQELADSLFSDLFGLTDGKRGERSLFRYFHGRSSLRTWLRTVLAQRHIDQIRAHRRLASIDREDGENRELPLEPVPTPLIDPHRAHYLSCFANALKKCVSQLNAADRERLELYYARQMKLAEVGRKLGEHESSVSRNLERIRRELRAMTEKYLRDAYSLGDAEIEQCFNYAAEDVPIDFRQMFPGGPSHNLPAGRKEPS
jgi:RNA polymerase sigma-70 factor (ECF subfamily)